MAMIDSAEPRMKACFSRTSCGRRTVSVRFASPMHRSCSCLDGRNARNIVSRMAGVYGPQHLA